MATVTVLSGPERRRRWASSEKASIVEESLRPGSVVTAVARRHDVHPNLLHHWRLCVDALADRARLGELLDRDDDRTGWVGAGLVTGAAKICPQTLRSNRG